MFFGKGIVSSSLSLIQTLTGACWHQEHQIFYDFGVNWYPAPATPLEGVARLLPSQTLSLAALQVEHRLLMNENPADSPVASLQEALVSGMRQLRSWSGPVFLALTGGFDSRTVLASACAAGLRPVTYTQEHGALSRGDRKLPPLLAARLGLSHEFIPGQKHDPEKQAFFDKHTMSQCIDADRSFYAHGQWDRFPAGALVLRGFCFEVGRGFYYRKIPRDFDTEAPDAAESLQRALYSPLNRVSVSLAEIARQRQPFITTALRKYLLWVSAHPEPGIDFRDRFYLEQRLGSWASTTEQALDLTRTVRISIANSHYILSLINEASERQGRFGECQKTIIRALTPALGLLPFNPASAWAKTYGKVIRTGKTVPSIVRLLVGRPVSTAKRYG
jgi:hypothetical protein